MYVLQVFCCVSAYLVYNLRSLWLKDLGFGRGACWNLHFELPAPPGGSGTPTICNRSCSTQRLESHLLPVVLVNFDIHPCDRSTFYMLRLNSQFVSLVISPFLTLCLQLNLGKPLCQHELPGHPPEGVFSLGSLWDLLGLHHLLGPACHGHTQRSSSKHLNHIYIVSSWTVLHCVFVNHVTLYLYEPHLHYVSMNCITLYLHEPHWYCIFMNQIYIVSSWTIFTLYLHTFPTTLSYWFILERKLIARFALL